VLSTNRSVGACSLSSGKLSKSASEAAVDGVKDGAQDVSSEMYVFVYWFFYLCILCVTGLMQICSNFLISHISVLFCSMVWVFYYVIVAVLFFSVVGFFCVSSPGAIPVTTLPTSALGEQTGGTGL